MLMIVMAKPMQLTIVKTEPLASAGALWATNVENMGESAITANPHISKKKNSIVTEF